VSLSPVLHTKSKIRKDGKTHMTLFILGAIVGIVGCWLYINYLINFGDDDPD